MNRLLIVLSMFFIYSQNVLSQTIPIQVYEFNQPELTQNQWNQISGGFQGGSAGTILPAVINPPLIPSSHDQMGIKVQLDENEVTFIYAEQPIETTRPILLRLVFHADSPNIAIALLMFEGNLHASQVDGSLGLNYPNNTQYYREDENTLLILYDAMSVDQITPGIQIVGLNQAQAANVLIDRLEVYELDAASTYDGSLFSRKSISQPVETTSTPVPTEIASPTPVLPTPVATATPIANQPNMINEIEPNDTIQQAQPIGSISIGAIMTVQGTLSSGGLQNQQYSGDRDIYRFTLSESADIEVRVDWEGNADVDLYGAFREQIITEQAGNEKPIVSQGTLGPGTFELILASKNNLANYTLTVEGKSPSKPIYPNQNSLLTGKYSYVEYFPENNGAIIYSLIFDGQRNYDVWSSVSPYDDELRIESGTYEVAFPFLITNDGTETKIYELIIESAQVIYIDGQKYQK